MPKKYVAWSAAVIIAFAQMPEIEKFRMPAARARLRRRPSPTRRQIVVAAELSERRIIGPRIARSDAVNERC